MCRKIRISRSIQVGERLLRSNLMTANGRDDPGQGIDDQNAEKRNKKAILQLVRPPQDQSIYQVDYADE